MRRLALVALAALATCPQASGGEARTSRAIWEKRIVHAPAVAPVLSGDTLWVVGTERRIYSIAAATGKRHWRKNLPGPAATEIVANRETIFVGMGAPARLLLALDRRDGKERWTAHLLGIPAALVAAGPSVVVGTTGGDLAAFAARDGAGGWKRTLGSSVVGIASGDRGRLFVLGRSDSLWCVDASDGSVLWSVSVAGTYSAGPVVVDSLLLCAAYDGEIVARHTDDGREAARVKASEPQIARLTGSDGLIAAVATGGEVETFHLPGLERGWKRETGETVSSGATAWGEWWVVPALRGRVLALTRSRGVDAWDLKLQESVYLPPAANRDYLGLIDERGRVMVYRLEQPQ